jgi:hypothetical protein
LGFEATITLAESIDEVMEYLKWKAVCFCQRTIEKNYYITH